MKQPKVITTPPPAPLPAASPGPRYRYFSVTPSTVTLRMRDLQVPEKARAAGYNSEQFVDLPCSEIFHGPAPKIPLKRLAELVPDCVTARGLPDEGVKLCSARLALAYVVEEGRELIAEPPPSEPIAASVPPSEEFIPPVREDGEEKPAAEPREAKLEEIPPPHAEKSASQKLPPPGLPEEAPEPVKAASPETPVGNPPLPAPPEPPAPPASSLPKIDPPAPASAVAPSTATTTFPLPGAKKPFSLFPMFRRKEEADNKPSTPIPRSRIELPKPKRPPTPLPPVEDIQPPVEDKAAEEFAPKLLVPPPAPRPFEPAPSLKPPEPKSVPVSEPPPAPAIPEPSPEPPLAEIPPAAKATPVAPPPGEEPAPPPPVAEKAPAPETPAVLSAADPAPNPEPPAERPPANEPPAVLVETEHVALAEVKPDISEQDALQAIFLTEEFLSVDRVLELCGNLPGIKSCVLSQNAAVIAAHNTPDSVDIVSLSAHALEMLKAMRSASAKMGIGAVPAVTVHSEKGPITFFHQEDLCLLVLHKDRGFVPGVREKLQQVVTELAQAKLPLPVGKKMLGP